MAITTSSSIRVKPVRVDFTGRRNLITIIKKMSFVPAIQKSVCSPRGAGFERDLVVCEETISHLKIIFRASGLPIAMLLVLVLSACVSEAPRAPVELRTDAFAGLRAGDERKIEGISLCWCPPGTFIMGSPPTEPERRPGEDQIQVTLTRGFWMGKFEVTQAHWKQVMGHLPGELTTELPAGDDLPVGNVNFAEAEQFCRQLTELARASGGLPRDWEFRLPTEAQWEYACRAGSTTATAFGDQLSSKQANFKGQPYNGAVPGPSLGHAAKVGSYPPNAWGLHDMHGNTFEWCRDWYHPKLPGGIDPDLYLMPARSRVRRGGAWTDEGWPCRSAFRLRFEPERRYDHIGFRVAVVKL